MLFEWIALESFIDLTFALSIPGYILFGLYLILAIGLFVRGYRQRKFNLQRWLLLGGMVIAAPLGAIVLTLSVNQPTSPLHGMTLAMLGLLPMVISAYWLGVAPAILVGFLTGLTWAITLTGRIIQPLEMALLAGLIAALLNQRYTGHVARWLRQPLVAAIVAAVIVGWPLILASIFVTDQAPAMTSLDRTTGLALSVLVGLVGESFIAGGLVQAVAARWPSLRPYQDKDINQSPPWGRHLNSRLLFIVGPLAAVLIAILVGVVAWTSYRVATRLVIEQMIRDATNAGSGVPFYMQLGRSLIRDLGSDTEFSQADVDLQEKLADGLRSVPFFQQLVYVDADEQSLTAYPEIVSPDPTLSEEEEARLPISLMENASAEVIYHQSGERPHAIMTFMAPVTNEAGEQTGVLLGRTQLDTSTIFEPVTEILREGFVGSGKGFIMDGQNTIILYPSQPELQNTKFELHSAREIRGPENGQAFRQYFEDGSRQLVYILPISGRSDWSVVVLVPDEVSMALAVDIALPTLVVLVILAVIALPLSMTITRFVTTPLDELLKAVDLITKGQLDKPLHISGDDEIGRLGNSFEQMRLSLKNRLSEQDRLLRVTRSVASSLELFRAMPPILSSALDVTNAAGVRVALRRHPKDEDLQTYAAGEAAAAMMPLDSQLINLVERQGTVVISQIERASPSLDISALPANLRSLVAFPLRSDTSFYGILWMCYSHEHIFEQSEMTFLSTLAGQTAVAIANARLFTEAQEGRNQLEAVLESTADAMVVVDNQGTIVLMNPSAERFFGVRSDQARGQTASKILNVPELANLLTNLQEPVSIIELPAHGGKTLLASTSTIVSHDGAIAGRVAVLRDISALKELDNLKTVFLRMVSHDMRSPLTFMKGYLSLMPLAGDLNEKQMDALNKINLGIEQISEMTERLLYLSRLQFGEEAELDLALVDVKAMVDEICQQQDSHIQEKSIDIQVKFEDALPLVLADSVLYRQAILNLISNAIKYSPENGKVLIEAHLKPDKHITLSIQDEGMGIRQQHQGQLFEAFYRVPHIEGDPKRPRGTGIGLALVKAVANAHGGEVGVKSRFGHGSTFYLTIPLRDHTDLR